MFSLWLWADHDSQYRKLNNLVKQQQQKLGDRLLVVIIIIEDNFIISMPREYFLRVRKDISFLTYLLKLIDGFYDFRKYVRNED